MTRINTNVEALRGLRNYQKSSALLTQSLTRLSTGLKINSGKDNPSGLIAGETLRLQTTTIEQSIKNSNRANNVISTADGALGEISGLLNQVRGLVQEGLNVGALSQDEINANQQQIDTALSAINRVSQNTTFAGDKLLDGSKAYQVSISTANTAKLQDYKINEALLGGNATLDVDARVTTAAQKAELRYTGGALTSAANLEIGGSKGTQNISLGGSSTLTQVKDAINNATDSTGITARILAGYRQTKTAVANSLAVDTTAANSDITFTDARATSSQGTDASLGGTKVRVEYLTGGNNKVFGVSTTTDSNTGDTTVSIQLATDGTGTATTTANQLVAAVNQDAVASKYVSAANTGASTGAGVLNAVAVADLAGGKDSLSAVFTDKRAAGSAGTVSIAFTLGASTAATSASVTRSGNDSTVTIALQSNASSVSLATYDDIKTAIEANADAKNLIDVDLDGDGSQLASSALASTAFNDATGTLVLESDGYGAQEFVNVNVLSGSFSTLKNDGTTAASRDSGSDIAAIINGQAVSGSGLTASIRTGSLDASVSFTEAANTVGNTVSLSITGGGSLFQIGEQATTSGQISLGLEAVNTARLGGITGKLYELGTGGGKSLNDVKASLEGTGPAVAQQDLVEILDQALSRVTTLRGRLGAIQKNVIETNISTLGVSLENITEARSQIVDTDFAAETANLQKAQVLNQAGISVLGIANQNPQQVLSLLRG